MNDLSREEYLEALGLENWQLRTAAVENDATVADIDRSDVVKTPQIDWETLNSQIRQCQRCALSKTRTNVVIGTGAINADLIFIGEAPGAQEDLTGEPFVGKAGKLLNEMLFAVGIKRDAVYIANILKCRPPNNRDPSSDETIQCVGFLQQQIALIKPKLIVAVGRIAAQYLLKTTESMGKLRQRLFNYGIQSTPLIVTYHPAYLLRSPTEKRRAYEDLLFIKDQLSNL